MKKIEIEDVISQEYDCPNGNIDFDILGEDILCVGESVYYSCSCCSCCGREHVAGGDLPDLRTMVHVFEDGELRQEWWGMPKDAEEKKAWTALSMAALEAHQATLGVLPAGSGWPNFEAFVAGAWLEVPERQQPARWPWPERQATREDFEDFRFLYAGREIEAGAWEDDCSTGNTKVVFIDGTGSLCASFGDFSGDDFDFRPERVSLYELAAMGAASKQDPQYSAFVTAYVAQNGGAA